MVVYNDVDGKKALNSRDITWLKATQVVAKL